MKVCSLEWQKFVDLRRVYWIKNRLHVLLTLEIVYWAKVTKKVGVKVAREL